MAHPARFLSQDNLTEMGITFYWTTAISDLLLILKIWFDKFCMEVIAKKNQKLSFVFNELSNSKIILKIEFCSFEKNISRSVLQILLRVKKVNQFISHSGRRLKLEILNVYLCFKVIL